MLFGEAPPFAGEGMEFDSPAFHMATKVCSRCKLGKDTELFHFWLRSTSASWCVPTVMLNAHTSVVWCPVTVSIRRRRELGSPALPTELTGLGSPYGARTHRQDQLSQSYRASLTRGA